MSLVIRYVRENNDEIEIKEQFITFLKVDESTGKNLAFELFNILQLLGIDIQNCRGQGYDNGANMKGKNNGVQAHILNVNPRAFYLPGACHNLNLLLGDIAQCNSHAVLFFFVLH